MQVQLCADATCWLACGQIDRQAGNSGISADSFYISIQSSCTLLLAGKLTDGRACRWPNRQTDACDFTKNEGPMASRLSMIWWAYGAMAVCAHPSGVV
jgi:hypothetical protein